MPSRNRTRKTGQAEPSSDQLLLAPGEVGAASDDALATEGGSNGSPGTKRHRSYHRRTDLLAKVVLSFLALIGLFPYLFMFITSFKTNEQFFDSYWVPALPLHLENYVSAWRQISPYLVTSLIVAGAAIIGTVILGSVSAFVFARFRFPGRNFLFLFIGILLTVPHIASLIPLFVLMRDLGILNTRLVLILPHLAGGTVLAVVLMRAFVEQIPDELFEAAQVDGAGGPRSFFYIMLPLSTPIMGTVALVTTIAVWNDYFWPLLTITEDSLRTIPVGLAFFQGQNVTQWGPLFAGYVLASLPLLILFTLLSKRYLAGIQGGLTAGH